MTENGKGNHLDILGAAGGHLAVTDAATRAGEMIAGQVRSVVEATDAHARTVVEEAQREARRVMGEARFEANAVREQIEAIAVMVEALLRDLQRDADRFGPILSPGEYFGGEILLEPGAPPALVRAPKLLRLRARRRRRRRRRPSPSAEMEAEPEAEPEPEPEAEPEPEPEAEAEPEPEAEADPEPEAEAEPEPEPEVEDVEPPRRRFAREEKPKLAVVEAETAEEWYAAVTKNGPADTPCAHCGTGGGCARCRGRGRRFGMRCPDCHGSGICPSCRGQGYIWASNRPRSAM